ncbi:TPA: TIGR03756 family integrating conjugative element protein, partial [Salmonella enterica subsp. enterica serovar Reading]
IPGYSCKSAATPLIPYFLSTLDSLVWRTGLPEALYPEALIPGKREIGSTAGSNMWGNVYPRSGFVTQQDDYKAGAVIAQRVADIITRSGQVHVYQPLTGHRRPGYWPPAPVTENTGTKNHKWQRVTPAASKSCAVFPDTDGKVAEDGNYAWTLWQPYSCCKPRGQTFLYSTDFSGGS